MSTGDRQSQCFGQAQSVVCRAGIAVAFAVDRRYLQLMLTENNSLLNHLDNERH